MSVLKAGADVWVDSPPMLNCYLVQEIVDAWLHGTVVAITEKGRVIVIPHGESIAEAHLTSLHKIVGRPKGFEVGSHNLKQGSHGLSAAEFIAIARAAIGNRENMIYREIKQQD